MKPIVTTAALFACLAVWSASATSDRSGPGPDSARVSAFLTQLSRTDPLICALVGGQWGNFRSRSDTGIGRFSDADAQLEAARKSLANPVTDTQAIEYLIAQLDHDSACVRRVAARMLGRSIVSNDRLAASLGSSSPRIREAAAYAIGEDGDRRPLRAPLERALSDRAPAVAAMAAWALGEIQDPASVEALSRSARSSDPRLRIAAVWALGEIEDPKSVADITAALRDTNPTLRAIAARALGNIGARASAEPLAAALSDSEAEVRYSAAAAIGDLDDLHAAPAALVRAASTEDPRLRITVAKALAEIADPATTPALAALVTDADTAVRLAAVEGLGEIATQATVPALTKALRDTDPRVRKAAAEGLGETKR